MKQIHYLFATGLGVGKIPPMPGTYGSLLGAALFLLLPVGQIEIKIASILVLIFLGAYTASKIEIETGVPDNSIIVIDEIAGMWITLLFVPMELWWIISAIVLFRILDIVKPFPIKKIERFKRGYGVMLDDVAAGIYAGIALWGTGRLLF